VFISFFGFGVKDFCCNIYGLVFNVRFLVFWAFGLGFRLGLRIGLGLGFRFSVFVRF